MKVEIDSITSGINLSAEDIITEIVKNPLTKHEISMIENYLDNLLKTKLVLKINKGAFYDKSAYDFYVNIDGRSEKYKFIMKKSIAELFFKYKIPEYFITKKLY